MSDTFTRGFELVQQLQAAESKAEVLESMRGVPWDVFIEIDERPGQFVGKPYEGNWFAWLRQLRNDPTSSLFENLT